MPEGKIDQVVAELREEEERLKRELVEVRHREQEIEKELAKIRFGVSALSGKAAARKASAGTSKRPSTEEVLELATRALEASSPLSDADLEEKVRAELRRCGKSSTGLRRELKKVLQTERFAAGLTGWKLAEHRVKPVMPREVSVG